MNKRERERERESLTHSNNTTNTDNFSLIYYIYRKIPETDSDGDYWLFTSVHYPFFYPFFARFLFFFQEYSIVIENKNFSEKILIFSVQLLFALCSELLLTMPPTWPAGVFFIYVPFLLSPAPDSTQRIRAPPLTTLRLPLRGYVRDAHAPNYRHHASKRQAQEKQKSRRAVTQRLCAELCSYTRNVRTIVTARFPVVNNESAVFVFFAGREKEKMDTFAPKGNIHGPILPQFILQMPITFGAKTMYAILCDYAADKDHCWPSQATLAKRLSCSISSVKNYLAELVREKLIFIRREKYRSSVYYLLLPDEMNKKQKTTFTSSQSESGRHEAKSGYLTNLSKQRKEENSPPSPHASGETTVSAVHRMTGTPTAGSVSSSLQDFESTWALYPKKEAKGFARLAWLKLLRSRQLPPLAELHAAIRRFMASESWQREQGRFVPQMGNWLRGQRWLDPVPPSCQAEQQHAQDLQQAMRAREEQEQRQHETRLADKTRLRPLFDAFAAKFPPVANEALPFGLWLHLHSRNHAPSANDVPPGNTLGIVEFLNEFKRRSRTADFLTKHQPSTAWREPETPCHSVESMLRSLPVSRFFSGEGNGHPERAAFAYA